MEGKWSPTEDRRTVKQFEVGRYKSVDYGDEAGDEEQTGEEGGEGRRSWNATR